MKPASDALRSPIALGALALWILNDHVFKDAFASWWTGKLSDVAGLIVFPLLVAAALEQVGARHRSIFYSSVALTAFAMIAIKTVDEAAWLYRYGLAVLQWPFHASPELRPVRLAMDPTDLFTLPALIVPIGLRRNSVLGTLPSCDSSPAFACSPDAAEEMRSTSR